MRLVRRSCGGARFSLGCRGRGNEKLVASWPWSQYGWNTPWGNGSQPVGQSSSSHNCPSPGTFRAVYFRSGHKISYRQIPSYKNIAKRQQWSSSPAHILSDRIGQPPRTGHSPYSCGFYLCLNSAGLCRRIIVRSNWILRNPCVLLWHPCRLFTLLIQNSWYWYWKAWGNADTRNLCAG